MAKNQLSLIPQREMRSFKGWTHGGVSLKKRRKVQRPLVPRAITHVVFKSSKAKGSMSFYKNKHLVNTLLRAKARKFFVELIDYVNMGNHLHIKARFNDPKRFQQFLKSFSGLLARKITGAKRGQPFGRFWDGLVFTRVLCSKLEELGLRGYFEGNHREREMGYAERELWLKRFNQFLYRLRRTRAGPKTAVEGA